MGACRAFTKARGRTESEVEAAAAEHGEARGGHNLAGRRAILNRGDGAVWSAGGKHRHIRSPLPYLHHNTARIKRRYRTPESPYFPLGRSIYSFSTAALIIVLPAILKGYWFNKGIAEL